MHFTFISSFVTASLALAAAAKPSDRLLSETLPTLPDKGEDSPGDIMVSPKGSFLDATKSVSSQYSLKLGDGEDDAKKKALGFKKSSGQKIASPPDLTTKLEPQNIKLKGDSDDNGRRLKGLRGNKVDTSFMADVAAPILLAIKLNRASGRDPSRRLQTADCVVLDDGSVACVVDGYPANGFYTIFVDCPVESPTVLDCLGCAVFGSINGEIDPVNDPNCLSCSVCFDTASYDCSNIAEGDCVAQSCSGVCTGNDGPDPVPSPTPVPAQPSPTPGGSSSEGGVSCQEDENGDVFCVAEDYPATGFLTVFLDCPFDTTNALQCGRCAVVPPDDTPLEVDLVNDEQCNSCTVCSDKAAYDCSNLDSGDCSVYDCGGTCSGPSGEPSPTPTPPAPQPTPGGPSPTFPSPTPPDTQPTNPSGPLSPVLPGDVTSGRTSSAYVTGKGAVAFVAAIGSMVALDLF